MAKVKTGKLAGVEWSSEESRKALYTFARGQKVPGINSKSSKPDIVSALDKASKKEARAAKKATPQRWMEMVRGVTAPPKKRAKKAAPKPAVEAAAPKPIATKAVAPAPAAPTPAAAPAVSPAEAFRRQVEKRRAAKR